MSHRYSVGAFLFLSVSTAIYVLRQRYAGKLIHGRQLPDRFVQAISPLDKRACLLLLNLFKERAYNVDYLLINGGYVRDLLLGRYPDDLDITVCLRNCSNELSVESILKDLSEYSHMDAYGFKNVKIASIVGDVSKDKNLDTAKAVLTTLDNEKVEIDLMPTIGKEHYDEANRVPHRDQRGTPKEDAERRDLTIGAMFISVSLNENLKEGLNWHFLDYFGGMEDLHKRILRSPCPKNESQLTWWRRILQDDPIRIIRVIRFAAKLDFKIHPVFWDALPAATQTLKSKVAGSRKLDELLKLAKLGYKRTLSMIILAFHHKGMPESLFGGKDAKGKAHFLPEIIEFDEEQFIWLTKPLENCHEVKSEQLLGFCIACAIVSCKFCTAESPLEYFNIVCSGLCTSRELRISGEYLLTAVEELQKYKSQYPSLDRVFEKYMAKKVEFCFVNERIELTFPFLVGVWNILKLGKDHLSCKLAILCNMLPYPLRQSVTKSNTILTAKDFPKLSGKILSNYSLVPPHMRGIVLARLNVLQRVTETKIHFGLESKLFKDVVKELYEDLDSLKLKDIYTQQKHMKL